MTPKHDSIVCKECKQECRHFAKGFCQKCYELDYSKRRSKTQGRIQSLKKELREARERLARIRKCIEEHRHWDEILEEHYEEEAGK